MVRFFSVYNYESRNTKQIHLSPPLYCIPPRFSLHHDNLRNGHCATLSLRKNSDSAPAGIFYPEPYPEYSLTLTFERLSQFELTRPDSTSGSLSFMVLGRADEVRVLETGQRRGLGTEKLLEVVHA